MERLITVEFGPSRSKRFGRAVAEARSRACECSEVEPGRYRARFVLGMDPATYTGLARLLERVRHWRATEVSEGDEAVSAYHAKEMAWCASSQLKSHGACRLRFFHGILPRCSVCPLFDAERAIRDVLGEHPLPGAVLEISFSPNLRALLAGELPPNLDRPLRFPNSRQQSGENPPARNHQVEEIPGAVEASLIRTARVTITRARARGRAVTTPARQVMHTRRRSFSSSSSVVTRQKGTQSGKAF